jgi:hypothetical protein
VPQFESARDSFRTYVAYLLALRYAGEETTKMARRYNSVRNEKLTPAQLEEFRKRLAVMTDSELQMT